jgi:hypothetical protein
MHRRPFQETVAFVPVYWKTDFFAISLSKSRGQGTQAVILQQAGKTGAPRSIYCGSTAIFIVMLITDEI